MIRIIGKVYPFKDKLETDDHLLNAIKLIQRKEQEHEEYRDAWSSFTD